MTDQNRPRHVTTTQAASDRARQHVIDKSVSDARALSTSSDVPPRIKALDLFADTDTDTEGAY